MVPSGLLIDELRFLQPILLHPCQCQLGLNRCQVWATKGICRSYGAWGFLPDVYYKDVAPNGAGWGLAVRCRDFLISESASMR